MKELENYYVPTKMFYEDTEFTSQVDEFFTGQDVGEFLYGEITPNIMATPLSQFDNVVWDVNSLLAQSLMADPSLDARLLWQREWRKFRTSCPM